MCYMCYVLVFVLVLLVPGVLGVIRGTRYSILGTRYCLRPPAPAPASGLRALAGCWLLAVRVARYIGTGTGHTGPLVVSRS
jgi:hypothetical protein